MIFVLNYVMELKREVTMQSGCFGNGNIDYNRGFNY